MGAFIFAITGSSPTTSGNQPLGRSYCRGPKGARGVSRTVIKNNAQTSTSTYMGQTSIVPKSGPYDGYKTVPFSAVSGLYRNDFNDYVPGE